MSYQIPTQKGEWVQPNRGDAVGNLYATFNMDFDSVKGRVRISPRTVVQTSKDDDSDLGLPIAFVRCPTGTDRWWALCTGRLFRTAGTDPSSTYTEAATDDGGTTSPPTSMTVDCDMEVYNSKLYVTLPTNIAELDATAWDNDWWTTIALGTALTSGNPHPVKRTIKSNFLLVADGNVIHAMDKNENVSNSRVILPNEFEIEWLRPSQDGVWIGATHTKEGEGQVFFWDEVSENYNFGYGVKAEMSFSGVIKDGIPWIVNRRGQLLAFDGSGFEELARFPIANEEKMFDLDSIQRNGMVIIDNDIHIAINTGSGEAGVRRTWELLENQPTGIWVFNKERGLTHKYSPSIYTSTENDYGNIYNLTGDMGALIPIDKDDGLFLLGAEIATNATPTLLPAILVLNNTDSIAKRGHFITAQFSASAFEDIFQDILVSFRQFINSGDKIVIKYRVVRNPSFPIVDPVNNSPGTWSDTDTFTTAETLMSGASAGDEVQILFGKGAGATAHISSLSEAGGTYTVNLDETIPNVSGTFGFSVNEWKKCATISTQGIERQGFFLNAPGTFIQLKVEMRSAPGGSNGKGATPELKKIVINNQPEFDI